MAEGKIYVAKTDGMIQRGDGSFVTVKAGVTRVREGHELLNGRMGMFRELDVHYDLEDSRSAPEQEKPVPEAVEPPATEQTESKSAGLTSGDAPTAPRPRRGRVTKTD